MKDGDKRVTEVDCVLTPYPVSQPPLLPGLAKWRQNLALNLFVAWSKSNLEIHCLFFFPFVGNNLKVAGLTLQIKIKSRTVTRDYYYQIIWFSYKGIFWLVI